MLLIRIHGHKLQQVRRGAIEVAFWLGQFIREAVDNIEWIGEIPPCLQSVRDLARLK